MARERIESPAGLATKKDNYNLLCVGIGGTGVIRASMILGWAAMKEGFKVRTAETHGMSQRGGNVSSYMRFGKTLEGPFMVQGDVDVLIAFELSEALRNLDYVNKNTHVISSYNTVIPPSALTHRQLQIDLEKCIGCGNCLAQCVPSHVFQEACVTSKNRLTLVCGPARATRNGTSVVLDSCTGCTQCIVEKVCPFNAITVVNDWEYPAIEDIEQDIKLATKNVVLVDAEQIAIDAGNVLAANVVIIGILAGLGIVPISADVLRETVASFVPGKALHVNLKAFDDGLAIGKARAGGEQP